MKAKNLFLFSALASLSLVSCGTKVHHAITDYVMELECTGDFRILQLSDTHIGDKDNTKLHYDFMDLTIKEASPDFIVITGDVFTFASKGTALEFFNYLDGHGIPWTMVWGNHDQQCYFSIDWVTDVLNNYGRNCYFRDLQDDDVQGNSNFAINLKKGGRVWEQLIFMDSNRYHFGSYMGYDYFKQNQIDWYKELVTKTTKDNGDVPVESLMFYHIPLPEIEAAWNQGGSDPNLNKNGGVKDEKFCPPDFELGFFKTIHGLHSTKGMYFGHDHVNNFIVSYEGIDFGYAIKATDRVYSEASRLGGRLITVKDDGDPNKHPLEYKDIYHTYSEVM